MYWNEEDRTEECGDRTSEQPTIGQTDDDDDVEEVNVTVQHLAEERTELQNDEKNEYVDSD